MDIHMKEEQGEGRERVSILNFFVSFDFSIFKQFRVTEGSQLQFRAEAFNLTNTPSFAIPNTSIDTSTAGRVTSTFSAPRQIQFALKYNF